MEYVPAAQDVQVSCPSRDENFPAGQAVQRCGAPKWPAQHGVPQDFTSVLEFLKHLPPNWAGVATERQRCWNPPLHCVGHCVHELHSENVQSTGHGVGLHD